MKGKNKFINKTSTGKTSLRSPWLEYYQSFSFSRKMATSQVTGKIKENHVVFNKLFYNYILQCQKDKRTLSVDQLREKSAELFEMASERIIVTDNDIDRLDSMKIMESLELGESDYFLFDNKEKSDDKISSFFYIQTFLLVHLRTLSEKELNFILSNFQAQFLQNDKAISIDAFILHCLPTISEKKVNKLLALTKEFILYRIIETIKNSDDPWENKDKLPKFSTLRRLKLKIGMFIHINLI